MLQTIVELLPIMNPFSAIPLLLALTKGFSTQKRLKFILSESMCVLVLMLSFYLFGSTLLDKLSISNQAVRATGGLLLLLVGLKMSFPTPGGLQEAFGMAEGEVPFLIPIAMPMLVGAGMIAKLIHLSQDSNRFYTQLWGIFGLVIISAFVLSLSESIMKCLGAKGIDVLERIMGLVLIMLGWTSLLTVARAVVTGI